MPEPTSILRLYLIQVASLPGDYPVVCYLVQTGDGKNILIDTGLPDAAALPPGFEPTLGKTVVEQLAALGLQPGDINTLICTHFDADHAGHHSDFANAEAVVQKAHYDDALTNPRHGLTRSQWDARQFRFVEGDTELIPGLELIDTNGHNVGHQSVLVRLPETGAVLLAIDAVGAQSDFRANRDDFSRDDNAEATLASTRRLLDLAQRENAALVVFGHDREQWKSLKKLPDYYN